MGARAMTMALVAVTVRRVGRVVRPPLLELPHQLKEGRDAARGGGSRPRVGAPRVQAPSAAASATSGVVNLIFREVVDPAKCTATAFLPAEASNARRKRSHW